MGQRVNIQYSVEMEDLKDEVERLLEGVHNTLHYADTFLAEGVLLQKEMLSLKTLEDIDQIRLQLAKADFTLGDVTNIVKGYISYQTQGTPVGAPQANEVEAAFETPQMPEIDIEAVIDNFKNGPSDNEVSPKR